MFDSFAFNLCEIIKCKAVRRHRSLCLASVLNLARSSYNGCTAVADRSEEAVEFFAQPLHLEGLEAQLTDEVFIGEIYDCLSVHRVLLGCDEKEVVSKSILGKETGVTQAPCKKNLDVWNTI